MNITREAFHALFLIMGFLNSAAALCGRRGSPAFRAAENIVDNSTSRDWSVLRCFLSRIIRVQQDLEEPVLFFDCLVKGFGFETKSTIIASTVDETLLKIKDKSQKVIGLVNLKHCLNHQMTCTEVRAILVCRQAIDSVYKNRPTSAPNRTAIT